MTLGELIELDCAVLLPREAAAAQTTATGSKTMPDAIRIQAQQEPTKLGYNVIVQGSNVRIPRIPFIQFLYGELAAEAALERLYTRRDH